MARKRGKKALYEVMSKARTKPGFGKTLEQMRQKKPDEKQVETVKENISAKKQSFAVDSAADVETSKAAAKCWRKPRVVQFNVGRIEFSMPYQLVVALVLGFVLLILAAFRLGQYLTERRAIGPAEIVQPINQVKPTEPKVTNTVGPLETVEDSTLLDDIKEVEPVTPKSTGNNVIVLVQYDERADLVPVQVHFANNGIETVIMPAAGRYFLQTKNRYDNPSTPGTDGYKALQEIIKAGAKYKAPPNFEPFATHLFSDAYGKKVN